MIYRKSDIIRISYIVKWKDGEIESRTSSFTAENGEIQGCCKQIRDAFITEGCVDFYITSVARQYDFDYDKLNEEIANG